MIPTVQITPTGYVAPTREQITSGLWEMMRGAFGGDISEDPRTPQGQLVTSLTAAFVDRDSGLIELGNNFDPRYASGIFQDALGAIYFMDRIQGTSSVVALVFTGSSGAPIPLGSLSVDDNGNEWETTAAATISTSGTVSVLAKCTVTGSIPAGPNSINQLKVSIPGIDRVTNPGPAVTGSGEEGRVDYEIRRAESVAANSKNTNNAVRGAVIGLPGVIDVYVVDNPSNQGIVTGSTNYPMIRNSLLVSVVGGDDQDIAKQILIKGGTGCAFVGNTDVVYFDTDTWATFPPEYLITFLRPEIKTVYFDVVVSDRSAVTLQQEIALKQSILDQMRSGGNRARIGGRVIPSAFICSLDRSLGVIKILVSSDGSTWQDIIQYGVDEFPASSAELITVSQI